MRSVRVPIVVPDLARSADKPITLSHWITKVGQRVEEGARVVDVICDKADFEVPAPASGVLVEAVIAFDAEVTAGQVIGWIDPAIEPWVREPPQEHPGAIGRCGHCSALLFPGELRCRNCAALI